MKITLNNAKGKILKTAKTVIREDIEVVPSLEKKNINANGTYTVGDGYAGIGEVVVSVTGGGSNSWAGVFSDERTYFVGEVVYYEGGIYERTKYSTMVQLPTNTEYWKTLAIVVGGTKEIHANGTYNITDFASIKVLVPDENSWCGEYDSEVNYKENAIVVYRRMIYLCIKDIDNKQAPDNEEYWDLIYRGASDATGSAGDILEGKVLYGNDGERLTGTMPNNAYREGDYFLELDASKPSETLYGAYNGTAMINLEEKTITENGTYEASKGKVISKVIVAVEGEVLPEISEPLTLIATKEGADEGELVIAYNLSQKSALPAGTNAPLGFVQDANFLPKNIKKDEVVFGLRGEYEGGGGAELNIAYGNTAPEDTSKLWVKTTKPSAVKVTSETIHPEETCTLLSATLSAEFWSGGGCAEVAGKIYLFGGGDYKKTIQCFDTVTETISTLSATLPLAGSGISAVANGAKIYLFGLGTNTNITASVYCFDTETETTNKLSAELPSGRIGIGTAKIGTKVYLFGGAYGFNDWTMYDECFSFDLDTETISTLAVTMPQAKAFMATAAAGNKIYLLGGKNPSMSSVRTVFYYDVETGEMRQLKELLYDTVGMARPKAETIGETIYLFNLDTGSIGVYEPLTETYTLLSVVLHNGRMNVSSNNADTSLCAMGNKIYAFGGKCNYISVFEAPQDVILATDNLQIMPTLSSNKFNLINTDTAQVEIGVNAVYKGNSEGIGELVEASLHNGTSWVTI